MNKIVFDASAVIAAINGEAGKVEIIKYLKRGVISTVNFSESVSYLSRANLSSVEARNIVKDLIAEVIDFDEAQACLAAEFKIATKQYGFSLGDCACLALAKLNGWPVLTADKAWAKADLGVEVRLIR
jgi:PIN domain nuclease of toxin-antitoxin system